VDETLQARIVGEAPERLIGDRAYDSDGLDGQLAAAGFTVIAPTGATGRRVTTDGRCGGTSRVERWSDCSRRWGTTAGWWCATRRW